MEQPLPQDAEVDDRFIVVYDQLRDLAAAYLRSEPNQLMLDPSALVHEAYLRLATGQALQIDSPEHFMAIAAVAMRRVLIDHARQRRSLRRELSHTRVSMDLVTSTGVRDVDITEVDDALQRLASINNRWARIVELRFFAGLTQDQVATILGVSRKTVVQDWANARSWLSEALSTSDPSCELAVTRPPQETTT